jgi:hypothetical protein
MTVIDNGNLNAKDCVLRKPLLTTCGRVLLEKLSFPHLAKKRPTFYGTQRCITVCTGVNRRFLSWPRLIRSMLSNPGSLGTILILSSNLCLRPQNYSFLGCSHQKHGRIFSSPLPPTYIMISSSHLTWFHKPKYSSNMYFFIPLLVEEAD